MHNNFLITYLLLFFLQSYKICMLQFFIATKNTVGLYDLAMKMLILSFKCTVMLRALIFHTPHFRHFAFSTLLIFHTPHLPHTLLIFYTPHFLHFAFSTLRIFYTPHFPHSPFSTLLIFHTPHLLHFAFSTLLIFHTPQSFSTLLIFHTPHFLHSSFSTLRIFYTPHFPHSASLHFTFIKLMQHCLIITIIFASRSCWPKRYTIGL